MVGDESREVGAGGGLVPQEESTDELKLTRVAEIEVEVENEEKEEEEETDLKRVELIDELERLISFNEVL